MDDKVVEKTELVISALKYAHENRLDISNKDDVKKILEVLDPEHTNDKEIEEFMELLKHAETFMELTASTKDHDKSDLPN